MNNPSRIIPVFSSDAAQATLPIPSLKVLKGYHTTTTTTIPEDPHFSHFSHGVYIVLQGAFSLTWDSLVIEEMISREHSDV